MRLIRSSTYQRNETFLNFDRKNWTHLTKHKSCSLCAAEKFATTVLVNSFQTSIAIKFFTKAVVWRCSVKTLFLKISQNSEENTCLGASFIKKVLGIRSVTLFKDLLNIIFKKHLQVIASAFTIVL